jgi:hypothetical protein
MYGATRRSTKPIYGMNKRLTGQGGCDPAVACMTTELLTQILHVIEQTKIVVDTLYPAAHASATYIAKMTARGFISPILFTRIAWRKLYAGQEYTGTLVQIMQIKDIYLSYGLDWEEDKLFEGLEQRMINELQLTPNTTNDEEDQSTPPSS